MSDTIYMSYVFDLVTTSDLIDISLDMSCLYRELHGLIAFWIKILQNQFKSCFTKKIK